MRFGDFLRLILVLSLLIMGTGDGLAGTPHTAYGKIFNSNGSVPANGNITFNSYIVSRPAEVLTQSSFGCSYSSGYWNVAVGNFPTPWAVGDVLRTEVTNIVNGETGAVEVTMTSNGSDPAPDLHLDPVVPVELASFQISLVQGQVHLEWTTESETNNLGFEIERQQNSAHYERIAFVNGHGTTTSPHKYSYTDATISTGTFSYRLKQIDTDGSFQFSEAKTITLAAPADFKLEKCFPNPFNPETTISYQIGQDEMGAVATKLLIYNAAGQLVRTLVDDLQAPGQHKVTWNGRDDAGNPLSSGLYLGKLITPKYVSAIKMLYMK
ncbi:MAG: hypothetical protein ONB16_00710 [candidate division KSB1 bacterium]|nr:hypothetical protein [candidate division KSB1 bacterium]MDZ7318407.1 hypothetical protein [candidate division KSB1 bacterium]MDZ7342006.1 hypothetical protein [candidate division KSB1 bacterium]